ncbi:16S rRNA (guanine(966)-N(2))-methyltransferase RsmD [Maridesulfovibrio ferrireducens]|uniref:16S rRNA (guanine(966)-N(2))-methyltransferase RsmD n=1 Tax=Maridesulfovibrio ferrireducens TaxID=246191 RepID=UPI001A1EA7B1|nr:16S rRNA (guanine(966)-N(2))-methyltransferase RsmD [Maridesulfovibrio ferrireducens]MBI9110485.1 16S rRNA (guanine(966)-N(2))-methyltransferase RsmD [Maridesulfovibrio ferrireducens]
MRLTSGKYGGRVIKTASGPGYRPATSKVRQAVFSMLESRGIEWDGLRVADMFAGSGSLAIEALSRGAEFSLFIEKNGRAAALIKTNLKELGVSAAEYKVLAADLFKVLSRPPDKTFDLIFIDPPYGYDLLPKALDSALKKGWLADGGFVLAEVEAQAEPPHSALIDELTLLSDKLYGQTRILLWRK